MFQQFPYNVLQLTTYLFVPKIQFNSQYINFITFTCKNVQTWDITCCYSFSHAKIFEFSHTLKHLSWCLFVRVLLRDHLHCLDFSIFKIRKLMKWILTLPTLRYWPPRSNKFMDVTASWAACWESNSMKPYPLKKNGVTIIYMTKQTYIFVYNSFPWKMKFYNCKLQHTCVFQVSQFLWPVYSWQFFQMLQIHWK